MRLCCTCIPRLCPTPALISCAVPAAWQACLCWQLLCSSEALCCRTPACARNCRPEQLWCPCLQDKNGVNEGKSPSRRTSHADELGGMSPTRSLQAGVSRRMLLGSAPSDAAFPLGSTINRASLPAGTSRLAFTP